MRTILLIHLINEHVLFASMVIHLSHTYLTNRQNLETNVISYATTDKQADNSYGPNRWRLFSGAEYFNA